MNLKDFATEIKAKDHFMKVGIGGFSGSGKTRTASEFAKGLYKDLKIDKPLLFIDNEKGSRFLVPFFKKEGIEVYTKETTSLADVVEAMNLLNSSEVGLLLIDSLTKVYYQFIRDYQKANKRKVMYLNDWGKVIPAWQEQFSDKFVECNGNFIFTGRGGYTYDLEENEKGKKEFQKSGTKMKLAGETPFEPDLNIWMERVEELKNGKPNVWREALIMKDRSDKIDGKVFKNPTYKDFQPVVKFICEVPTGEVAGKTFDENLAPDESGSSEYYANKKQSEIEMELLKDLFIEYDIAGTKADQKKMKIALLKKLFGTSSGTELEGFSYEEIKEGRLKAQHLLYGLREYDGNPIEYIEGYVFDKKVENPDDLLENKETETEEELPF